MPTGHQVVDAFKNLIRHGKHHNHAKQEREKFSGDHDHSPSRFTVTQAPAHLDVASPNAHQAAAIIVDEERDALSRMPEYRGLETFKLTDKMGDGAFSNVYRAFDLTSGRKVAVKVVRKLELSASQYGEKHLNPQFKKKPRVTERSNILKEVQIMRGTNHPSIVRLYSFSESMEHYFLVLELMQGGELFHQIVQLTYFSENLSRHVILQVAQGLRYLHEERGVVHRDIKPENLLFNAIPIVPSPHIVKRLYDEHKADEGVFIPGVGGGGIGRVKIADFGLSKIVWNEETMTPCGTVGYTAPEIVKDERYSKSVDMWAMGCVLYTLLCGFPPFYDESIEMLTEKVARGQYTFLSPWWDDIGHSVKDLVKNLLCVDPAKRYTIDEFLNHPWCSAAPAPLPPPTPFAYPTSSLPMPARPLDSPLLRGPGRCSPGVATLKEAFDITYAVHRMEEEGARRRRMAGARADGARNLLGGLNEDDEDVNVIADVSALKISDNVGSRREAAAEDDRSKAAMREKVRRAAEGGGGRVGRFELDMEGATLLGRRGRKMYGKRPGGNTGMGKGSPLAPTQGVPD